jgi:hypothetical protein
MEGFEVNHFRARFFYWYFRSNRANLLSLFQKVEGIAADVEEAADVGLLFTWSTVATAFSPKSIL